MMYSYVHSNTFRNSEYVLYVTTHDTVSKWFLFITLISYRVLCDFISKHLPELYHVYSSVLVCVCVI